MVKRNQRGITLIALVITIIILIILAGISINLLLGENGIITRTKTAKEQHEYAAAKEIIDLKLADIYTDAVSKNEEYTMKKITTEMDKDTTITTEQKYFNTTASLKKDVSGSVENLKGIVVSANQYSRFKFLVSEKNGSIQLLAYTTESVPDSWTTGDLPTGFIAIGENKQATQSETPTTPPSTGNKIIYNINYEGGTNPPVTTAEAGATITMPTPTRENYRFLGWYDAETGGNKITFTTMPAEDTEIYAHWATTIAGLIEDSGYYGMETNYQVEVNGVTLGDKTADVTDADASLDVWKVFYKDTNGDVYLIYGDYLPAKCVPQAAKTAGLQSYTTDTSRPYTIYGVGENDSTASGQNSHNEAIRDALVSALGTASYWTPSFGKTIQGKSATATGAPTIEQFQSSYGTLDLSAGYASGLDNTNTLYFPHSSEKQICYGYWLASAVDDKVDRVRNVRYDGYTAYTHFYNATFSARPVICLPYGMSGTMSGTTLNIDAD